MKLRRITDPGKVRDEEIRRRALDGSRNAVTRHFVAIEDGREVAFVSLDIFPPSQQPLVLYTLVVPKSLREHGVGSRVLAEATEVCAGLAAAKILRR